MDPRLSLDIFVRYLEMGLLDTKCRDKKNLLYQPRSIKNKIIKYNSKDGKKDIEFI